MNAVLRQSSTTCRENVVELPLLSFLRGSFEEDHLLGGRKRSGLEPTETGAGGYLTPQRTCSVPNNSAISRSLGHIDQSSQIQGTKSGVFTFDPAAAGSRISKMATRCEKLLSRAAMPYVAA